MPEAGVTTRGQLEHRRDARARRKPRGSARAIKGDGRVGSSETVRSQLGNLRHGVPRQVTCAATYQSIHRSELAIESGCSMLAGLAAPLARVLAGIESTPHLANFFEGGETHGTFAHR